MATQKWPTKEELVQARKDRNYGWLGSAMWQAFLILPKSSPVRKYHSEVWKSLSEEEKEDCE